MEFHMKKLLTYLTVFILLAMTIDVQGKIDENAIKKKLLDSHTMGSNSQGRKFLVGFPPNEKPDHPSDVLEIYVTSSANTTVTLRNKAIGLEITKPVKALDITKFSSATSDISFAYELREEGVARPAAFVLESPQPISVYVLNAKPVSSEGYLAIPVSGWGTNYVHNSFYDFNEIKKWRTGFMILAAYDNTKVRIKLKGVNWGGGKTAGGYDLGDKINVTLSENDAYMIQGDGLTRGLFDLSGTSIIADKPIGLLSFHERTMIPAFTVYNGRDHLIEMIPPTTAWGKYYTSVEYARGTDKGDFFRIIASEDNTKYRIRWYDIKEEQLINQREGTLKNAGDFEEFIHAPVKHPHDLESIRGTSIFEFDKPALVCQYDYSAEWDGVGGKYDPFMIIVVPEEQFTKSTVFQTPDNKEFNENFFNIIAIGDTTDPNATLLKSITLDGDKIAVLEPSFVHSRIPGTNHFWAKLQVDLGAHVLKGDTKFGGYIYGFSSYDTYGWPAAMAIKKLDETDTLEPVLNIEGECGSFFIQASELRYGDENDNPRQVDQGISDFPELVDEYSYNFKEPQMVNPEWKGWPPSHKFEEFEFILEVEDVYADGFAVFTVVDRYGNVAIDSVRYEADSLVVTPDPLDFKQVRVNTTAFMDVDVKSESDSVITIKSIRLKEAKVFKIALGEAPRDIMLDPRALHQVKLSYTPIVQYPELPEELDVDSLIIETNCLTYIYPVIGQGIEPIIWVDDWDAGTTVINQPIYNNNGLWIRNKGTMDLVITGVDNVPVPFTMSSPTEPQDFPITIKPFGQLYLTLIGFEPTVTGTWDEIVTFQSNATVDPQTQEVNEKAWSNWTGKAIEPSVEISSYDWLHRRKGTTHNGEVYIKNRGTAAVRIIGVELTDPATPHFTIVGNDKNASAGTPFRLYPIGSGNPDTMITVQVQFHPQDEFDLATNIYPVVHASDNLDGREAANYLRGYGEQPKIEVVGYEFVQPILSGDVSYTNQVPGTTGNFIKIRNTSESGDLHISYIDWSANNAGDSDDFMTMDPLNSFRFDCDTTLLIGGDDWRIPVDFLPNGPKPNHIATFSANNNSGDLVLGESEYVETENDLIGHSYTTGFNVTPIDYGLIMQCDQPSDITYITNLGSEPITINDVKLVDNNPDNFIFRRAQLTLNGNIVTLPGIVLNENEVLEVEYIFDAYLDNKQNDSYSSIIEVHYNDGTSDLVETTTIEGGTKSYKVTLSLPTLNDDKVAPGIFTNPHAQYDEVKFPVNIAIESAGNWVEADITSFEFQIEYDGRWIKLANEDDKQQFGMTDIVLEGDMLANNWVINAEELPHPTRAAEGWKIARIWGTGGSAIPTNGVLCYINFQLLLSDMTEFTLDIINENITYNDRDNCIVPLYLPGSITLSNCVQDLRNVVISNQTYSLQAVRPNPVTSDVMDLNFAVAFDDHTRIELVSNDGTLRILLDKKLNKGQYEMKVLTRDLPSGAYTLRMTAGAFVHTEKIIISK